MSSNKKTISYALGDQTYNKDYPSILLEFLDGTRTINNPNIIKLAKQLKGPNYKEYLALLSQIDPIGMFMLTYSLSYRTIREYKSKYPAFKNAFNQAYEGSKNYIHYAYLLGAITDKQYASALYVNHGVILGAPTKTQLSLPPAHQQITVQNA